MSLTARLRRLADASDDVNGDRVQQVDLFNVEHVRVVDGKLVQLTVINAADADGDRVEGRPVRFHRLRHLSLLLHGFIVLENVLKEAEQTNVVNLEHGNIVKVGLHKHLI